MRESYNKLLETRSVEMNSDSIKGDVACVYHAKCMDGMAAAWVVRQQYPNAELILGEYHKGVDPRMFTDKIVYIVDFSYDPETLTAIAEVAQHVTVIDHHESAIRKLEGFYHPYVTMLLVDGIGGCKLTWDYIRPNESAPAWIEAIADRDIWRFALPFTKAICAYIMARPMTVEWLDQVASTSFTTICTIGQFLLDSMQARIPERIASCAYRMDFQGHDVPCINIHPTEDASSLLNVLCEGEPFAIGWYASKDHLHYSFRSKPSGVNVAELLEPLGGGGHARAAGYTINRI